MIRPMLLAYIDDLIMDETKNFDYAYEIYCELVLKWIEREPINNERLYSFSVKVAEYMFWKHTIYISISEIEDLCKNYNIPIDKMNARARSLLTRNANGDYKFSHKSILEYFLAWKAYDEVGFRRDITLNKFVGYDMVNFFLKEMCLSHLQKLLDDNPSELKDYSFNYMQLSNINFLMVNIINCDFSGCNLSNNRFFNVKFENVRFIDANLQDASFACDSFDKVNFSGADLTRANLTFVELKKANLQDTFLFDAKLKNVSLQGANLANAYLQGVDLTSVNLQGVDLYNVELKGVNLCNANLQGVILAYKNFDGMDLRYVNFQGADLRNANMKGAHLFGADLVYANIRGTIFKDVDFERVTLDNKQVTYLKDMYNLQGVWVFVMETEEIMYYEQFCHRYE